MMRTNEQLNNYYNLISRNGGLVSRCEMWLPPLLEGATVLDLGCRRGKGVYEISEQVGASGKAIGIDWSDEFIADAQDHADENIAKLGFPHSNMTFSQGYFENLASAGIADESVDVVIANSILNQVLDRAAVFAEIARVLKVGGELYHATVVSNRQIPRTIARTIVLGGDTTGGALEYGKLEGLIESAGFGYCCQLFIEPVTPPPALEQHFFGPDSLRAVVMRAFKLAGDSDGAADTTRYIATYEGGIPKSEDVFVLSDDVEFKRGVKTPIDRDVVEVLTQSRYKPYFRVE